MTTIRRSEMSVVYDINTWRDFPPMNASMGNMLHNKTGSWRFIKPVYEDKIPACQNACPAGNDIEAWIKLIREGEYERAYWHIKREEPFPAVLGRVCFSFCEDRCNRVALDGRISIRELERFVGDRGLLSWPHPDLPPYNGKNLCVIGSGPAGMSAAYFGRLLGFEVTIFEALPELGGILRVGIPEYRLSKEIVEAEFRCLRNMGINLKGSTAVGKDVPFEQCLKNFDYVFLAPGTHGSRKLQIPGAEISPHVMTGLAILKQITLGKRVGLGRRVVVIGGGNTAMDAARTAVRLGSRVTVIYRRTETEMPAHPEEIKEAREEGVEVRFLATPERVELGDDGSIRKLICCGMELAETDESGRRHPVRKRDDLFEVEADTIVAAIGEMPQFEPAAKNLDAGGDVLEVDEDLCALTLDDGMRRIFAGGDIIDAPRTVAHAVAAGKRAAIAMDCRREGKNASEILSQISLGNGSALSFSAYMGWEPLNPVRRNLKALVAREQIVYDYFQKTPRVERHVQEPAERKHSFNPYTVTFTEEQALGETARCMHCGRCTECDNCLVFCPDMSVLVRGEGEFGYMYDYDYCKGCGVCFTECPRHAITMVDEETPV